MSIKQMLKKRPFLYNLILRVLNALNYFNIRFRLFFPSYSINELWKKRIEIVKQCPDNEKIQGHPDGGKILKNCQLMHNALKITLGSYYDYGNAVLLQENKGIHEPQEEYVFQEVLKTLPSEACMMELGSYWAFYSMWFAASIKKAKCIMIEPDPHKMNFGKLNFKLNKLTGTFDLAFVDQYTNLKPSIPSYSVDHLFKKHKINFLHILHSDIQGFEYKMLQGALDSINENKIGYIFISTHSNKLHYQCKDFLEQHNFEIICSFDLDETYSWDGVLVGKHKALKGINSLTISKKPLTI